MAKKLKHGVDFVGVATVAFVEHEGRYLLVKRKKGSAHGGYWAFPGGKLNHGEKTIDTVRREVKEEIGLTIKKPELLFFQESIGRPKGYHFISIWYKAFANGKIVLQESEVTDAKWFTPNEILKKDLAFHHLAAFKRYLENKEKY